MKRLAPTWACFLALSLIGTATLFAQPGHQAEGESSDQHFHAQSRPAESSDLAPIDGFRGRPGDWEDGDPGPPRRGMGRRMGPPGSDRPREGMPPHAESMGRGAGGPPDGGAVPAPEEIEEFMTFAGRHFPQLHEQLVAARDVDEQAFRQMLHRIAPPMTRLMRMARDNPDEAERIIHFQKIEMLIREQQRRLFSSRDEGQKAAARDELRRLLEERFDLRLDRLRSEIEDLRQRIDEQTQRLAEQDRNKSAIIEEEFARMAEPPRGWERGPRFRGQQPGSRPAGRQESY